MLIYFNFNLAFILPADSLTGSRGQIKQTDQLINQIKQKENIHKSTLESRGWNKCIKFVCFWQKVQIISGEKNYNKTCETFFFFA